MFAFLKRFRRKKPVAKPVESLTPVKSDPPPMPVTRPPRSASVRTPTIAQSTRTVETHVESVYESSSPYYPTPLYVPMDSPVVEVYTPSVDPMPAYDCSPSYSAPDPSPSYECSSSSIDNGSPSTSDPW